jgi:hypothetical protein
MAWICEVTVTGSNAGGAADSWINDCAGVWSGFPGLLSLDIYEPANEKSDDPYNHETEIPHLIAILDFETPQAVSDATGSTEFRASIEAAPEGLATTVSVFERAFYNAEGEIGDHRLQAPVSYVVRYQKPAADEQAFIKNYVDSHPPTQAKLPNIRSIMCYFPRPELNRSGLPGIDYLIGNEVVFESAADFNAAMLSPVREELRSHFRDFPAFSGVNSHYLMNRRRVIA